MGWLIYILPAVSNLILVLLGLVMSFPNLAEAIEKSTKLRILVAFVCLLFGLIGLGSDVSQRRSSDEQTRTLVTNTGTLVDSTKTLVESTNQMVVRLGVLEPRLTAINDHLLIIDQTMVTARTQRNPALVANLQAQRNQSVSTLLSMTPGIVSELHYWQNKCDQEDIQLEGRGLIATQPEREDLLKRRTELRKSCAEQARPLIISANYVRESLLHVLPPSEPTEEEKKQSAIFSRAVAGEPVPYFELGGAAQYLQALTQKFKALPPSGLSAQLQ